MNFTRVRTALLIAATLCLPLLTCAAEESLADVARNTRPAVHAKRVVTNDDLPAKPEAPLATARNAFSKSADGDDADAQGAPATDGNSENEIVRSEIQRIKKAEASLEQKLATIKGKLASEPDEFRRRMWAEALDNQRITLEQYKKLREQLERSQKQEAEPQNEKGGV